MAKIAGWDGDRARPGFDGVRLARAMVARARISSIRLNIIILNLVYFPRCPPWRPRTIVLFLLALVTRDWRSIALAGLLAAINVGLIFAGLHGAAAEAAPDAKRFLRVVTFNLRFDNDRIDGVDKFLNQTDADVVVLQEVTKDASPAAASGAGLSLSLQRGRVQHRHLLEIRDQGRRTRRPARLSRMDPPAGALGRARRERDRRRSGRGALRAALLSRAARARRDGAHAIRADPEAADHRGRRLQHDAVDRSAEAVHAHDRARPIQYVPLHLADAVATLSACAGGRHRQCVRLAGVQPKSPTIGGARQGSDHRPIIADIALATGLFSQTTRGRQRRRGLTPCQAGSRPGDSRASPCGRHRARPRAQASPPISASTCRWQRRAARERRWGSENQ